MAPTSDRGPRASPVRPGVATGGNDATSAKPPIVVRRRRGSPAAVMTRTSTAETAAALTATLGFAAASWVVASRLMPGMHTGAESRLGSFGFFAVWAAMVAAMMARAAGAVVIAAGAYELTPRKQRFPARCREGVRSGLQYGLCWVGSSLGLMLVLVALGVMSVPWMLAIAVLGLAQKLLPANAAIDIPLALAIAALGFLIIVAPSSVPRFMAPR